MVEMNEREDNEDSWNALNYNDVKTIIEMGDNTAKTKLAWLMLSGLGGAGKDEEYAVNLLKERVEEDDGEAMWILGLCNEYGMGTKQDIEQAEILYKHSKEKGNYIDDIFATFKYYKRGRGILICSLLLQFSVFQLHELSFITII